MIVEDVTINRPDIPGDVLDAIVTRVARRLLDREHLPMSRVVITARLMNERDLEPFWLDLLADSYSELMTDLVELVGAAKVQAATLYAVDLAVADVTAEVQRRKGRLS